MTMSQWLRLAGVIVWTCTVLMASAWVGLVSIDYFAESCHGLQECLAQASFLNNAFFLFFFSGILIDGTEWLIRRRHGPRA
jgi:hypothetical protein